MKDTSDIDKITLELLHHIRQEQSSSNQLSPIITDKPSYLSQIIKYEYQQNSRIEHFMNPAKTFPIEKSYINLVIVKAKDQQEKEKQLHDKSHGSVILGAYEQVYGAKNPVDVNDIFESCKQTKKQVLVFGRAGIGKSTFCRFVAQQWAKGLLWPQYELLAVIPLRRLITSRYPSEKTYSLIDIIKKEVLQYVLAEEDELLLRKQFDTQKILWILDGYDEIMQSIPSHLKYLLEQLLQTPHHILTSRPYLNTLSYDVQMEITGFTDENIEQYVHLFFDQLKHEVDNSSAKIKSLLRFLKLNPSAFGVAHIPVNLELICSIWSNDDLSSTQNVTLTALYTMMTEWLCRRYLQSRNIDIKILSEEEIDENCKRELAFLQCLAFHAMETNTIMIRPPLLKKALQETSILLTDHPHILNFGVLKSSSKQGMGTQVELKKDHYFIHLSFQEYFAALYVVNLLKTSSSDTVLKFIEYHKYNQRYALMFHFMTGLVCETDIGFTNNKFWNSILTESIDLIGIRHIQLIIRTLEATFSESSIIHRIELLEYIARIIKQTICQQNVIILKHLSSSLETAPSLVCDKIILSTLIDLLCHDQTEIIKRTLSLIARLRISNLPTELCILIAKFIDHQNESVRRCTCYVLGEMGEKAATDEVINKLASALTDESASIRQSACNSLIKMGEKAATDEVIIKLVNAISDESEDVRLCVYKALETIGAKAAADKVITKLIDALADQRYLVRRRVCYVLGKMGEKAATEAVINKLVNILGDENYTVRHSAHEALIKMNKTPATNKTVGNLVVPLTDEHENVRTQARDVLQNIDDKAAAHELTTELLSAIQDENEYVRTGTYNTLGTISEKAKTEKMIRKLLDALENESEYVRITACELLGKMSEKAATDEVITKLVGGLTDKNASVRHSICDALKRISETSAKDKVIQKLQSALEDRNKYVRRCACDALGRVGEKLATNEIISKLVGALSDTSIFVRSSACDALGMLDGEAITDKVVTELLDVLGNGNASVRQSVCKALKKISETSATDKVIQKLQSTLEDTNEYIRHGTCIVLGRIGEKAATEEVIRKLVNALEDENMYVRSSACDALRMMGANAASDKVIDKLVSTLKDEIHSVRNNAYDTLEEICEKIGTNEVIRRLGNALTHGSEYAKSNACDVLQNIDEKAATDEMIRNLVDVFANENCFVLRCICYVLGKMAEKSATDEVISKLVDALENKNEDVRYSACDTLGKMGGKAATNEVIKKLVSSLSDQSHNVRNKAYNTLMKISEKAALNDIFRELMNVSAEGNWNVVQSLESFVRKRLATVSDLIEVFPGFFEKYYLISQNVDVLSHFSSDQLLSVWSQTKNNDWLSIILHTLLLRGVGLTISTKKCVLYESKEPVEVPIPNEDLWQELHCRLIDQAKRFSLDFDNLSKVAN